MVRTPGYDKFGMKKGTWTPEEDKKLTAYITEFGHSNWRQLPKYAGLARCGKSCRLRWMNYLRPDVKRGNYSKEEEDTIVRLHNELGNRWSAIAAKLPGRTDNEVKNYWHTNLKNRRCKNTTSNETNSTSNETNSNDVSSLHTTSNETNPNDDFSMCIESISNDEGEVDGEQVAEANNMYSQVNGTHDAAISHPPQQCYGDFYSNQMAEDFTETSDSFWTEPFLSETLLMGNGDFAGASEAAMIHPAGLFSPPYYKDFFGGEVFYQYDDLFSSF